MKKFALPAFLILLLVLTSCKKDNSFDKYEGDWAGTYSGDDAGSWTVHINSKGNVSGTAVSDSLPEYPFNLTGTISEDGKFNAQVDVFIGSIDFDGQITGASASGNWTNAEAGIEGTWSGEKQ